VKAKVKVKIKLKMKIKVKVKVKKQTKHSRRFTTADRLLFGFLTISITRILLILFRNF
jgi:hypothetical protein